MGNIAYYGEQFSKEINCIVRYLKEGLRQVIVNDEGTHYIVTELDDSTLQVEGAVYAQTEGREGEEGGEGAEGGGMVVYLDGTAHNVVMEG